MKKLIFLIVISLSIVILPSCVSSGPNTKVGVEQDGNANTRDELSGKWNDADLRDTAKTLIDQMLTEAWYTRALAAKSNNELPSIKIGKIKNKTDAHLPMGAFTSTVQRVLINSGKMDFAGDFSESKMIRKEKNDQMNNASDDSVKEAGNEAAADYMVFGQFTSMSDRVGGKQVKYLQVNLKLIDIEKNRIVWVGEKKIKKFVQQKSRTW